MRVEVQRHLRTTSDPAAAVDVYHTTFDRRAFKLTRRSNSHRETVAFANILRRQIIVQNCDQLRSIRN